MDLIARFLMHSTAPRRNIRGIMKEFAEVVGEMKGRCIDIGSGPGYSSHDIILPTLNPSAKLVCLDISEKMVEFGRMRYKNNDRLSFVAQDIETSNLPRDMVGQFDHAFSFNCLHWCRDLRQVFQNFYKLLKPGGSSIVLTFSDHPLFNNDQKLTTRYHTRYRQRMTKIHRSQSKGEVFETLLKDVGFEVVQCRLFDSPRFYETEEIDEFLSSTIPFGKQMPSALLESDGKDVTNETPTGNFSYCSDDEIVRKRDAPFECNPLVMYFKKPPSNSIANNDIR